jgi:hypothetical protein
MKVIISFLLISNIYSLELLETVEGQSQTAIIKVQTIKDEVSRNQLSATCFNLGSLKSTLSDLTNLSFSLKEEYSNGKKVLKNAAQAKVMADSTIGFCTRDASLTYSGNGITIEKVPFKDVKKLQKRLNSIEIKVNEADEIIRTRL